MSITTLLGIALSAALVNNFVLSQFLGCCPFFGVSKKTDTAVGMGMAVTFVMALAGAATWLINNFVLIPLNLEYMQTIAFILVIATLVQFVEMFMKKSIPALYQSLGIFLPLITTNCAVLGAAINSISYEYNFIEGIVYNVFSAVGFLIAIVLFASVRERLAVTVDCPKSFEGFPIALISAALLAMAFMGFQGLKIW